LPSLALSLVSAVVLIVVLFKFLRAVARRVQSVCGHGSLQGS
jgi:hypothetical protein